MTRYAAKGRGGVWVLTATPADIGGRPMFLQLHLQPGAWLPPDVPAARLLHLLDLDMIEPVPGTEGDGIELVFDERGGVV